MGYCQCKRHGGGRRWSQWSIHARDCAGKSPSVRMDIRVWGDGVKDRWKAQGSSPLLLIASGSERNFPQKITSTLLKDLDAFARNGIKDELASLDPLLRNIKIPDDTGAGGGKIVYDFEGM